MDERKQAEKLSKAAPSLSEKELEAMNSEYQAYIFRNRKKREIWTSCCGRHEMIPAAKETDALHEVMIAEHQAEERGYMHRHRKRTSVPCPFCGKDAYVKEVGRCGKCDNLSAYKRFVVFRWYRGALWACAYYTSKIYSPPASLTAKPSHTLYKVYRFKQREAICASSHGYWNNSFYSVNRLIECPKKLPLRFYEPFTYNSEEGMGYTLIGADEIEKSPLKYCEYKEYFRHYSSYMRFLALCCIMPRQVEMLMKAGLRDAVSDLAEGRRWNAFAFNWREPDPLKSFQLSKEEMRDFLSSEKSLETLSYYKQFRRQKIICILTDVDTVCKNSPSAKTKIVINLLKLYRIEPSRWNAYIRRELEAANGKKKQHLLKSQDITQYWLDYINAAVELGYDLSNPLMCMPKGIIKKHDAAAKAAAPVIAARLTRELKEKELERLEQVMDRYGFELGEYIIRAPINLQEIVNEGETLKHCVGGYAERHLNGKLTILFLRKRDSPSTPFVTIEMHGNSLVQIHGYNNDVDAKIKPRKKYAEILGPWLSWVESGSKRDKSGNPILPEKKQRKSA